MEITDKALQIIRETREMLLPFWGNVAISATKNNSELDVVTKLDFEVESFLAKKISEIDPGAGFKGEEYGGETDSSRFWLCDPIDGTSFFVRGMPSCTSMLALVENGMVTFSAIYDFTTDVLFHAVRGGGAYKNGKPIHVSTRKLTHAFLGIDTHLDKQQNYEKFLQLRRKSIILSYVPSGCIYSQIAEGKVEGRVCLDPWGKDWDFAPGSLLVSEAGGVVANLGVSIYDYHNLDFIAANKEVYEALTEGPEAIFPVR